MTMQLPRRAFRYALASLVAVGVMSLAPTASAEVDTFVRFEEIATGNWTVTRHCPDSSTVENLVTVRAGTEFESPDTDETFASVLVRGFNCEGDFVVDRSFQTLSVSYTSSPSMQEAQATGTVVMRSGSILSFDVAWEATGPLETNINQTQFEGFVGIFTSKLREATATGTITIDSETLELVTSQSAEIETLEDRTRRLPSGD